MDAIMDGTIDGYTYHETLEKDLGRIEKRRCWSTNNLFWLEQKADWDGLASIAVVETTIIKKNKTTVNRRYFISDLPAEAKRMLRIIRGHWSIGR